MWGATLSPYFLHVLPRVLFMRGFLKVDEARKRGSKENVLLFLQN